MATSTPYTKLKPHNIMKKTILTIGLLIVYSTLLLCQAEKEITSSIKSITLYTQGAQIENEASVSLLQGQMVLKFTKLSPYIKKESIRIEGDGSFTIQNVQHQNDFVNELEKNKETAAIRTKIGEFQDKIEYEQTLINILVDKLDFLKTNKEITGKEQAINPDVFNSLNSIYGNNIESLTLEKLKKERLLKEYNKEINKLNNQLNYLNNRTDLPSGTIIVSIDAKQTKSSKISFSYLVDNARWYPSYDIRFASIDKPLTVTYKANISQNTGVDWTNVNIILSTSKTNISAQIPTLSPFYLQFYYPKYDVTSALQGKVAGVQISESPNAIRANNIISIRGAASLNGNSKPLYVVDGVPHDDISYLNPDEIGSIEVLKDASATAIYGSRGSNGVVLVTTKSGDYDVEEENASLPLTITSKREISNEYSVETPQTIVSNDKTSTIIFKETKLNSTFEYQTIPLLTEHVFLIGKISDWYKTDLLDGEANIYLENSYVGKSFINTQQFNDTLDISFGVDNNISVKREKLSDFSESQLIGLNRKVTVAYKLTIRNNKAYSITAKVFDQIPVTTIKDIQVEPIDISAGSLNANTGKLEWDLELKPNEVKDLIIKYSVKYPKDKNVIIE
jgi:TonB-dependent SusC/RagA subfamily outer membrane receptor